MQDILQFFVEKKRQALLKDSQWPHVAEEANYGVFIFSDHIQYANPVFKAAFPEALNQRVSELWKQWFSGIDRQALEQFFKATAQEVVRSGHDKADQVLDIHSIPFECFTFQVADTEKNDNEEKMARLTNHQRVCIVPWKVEPEIVWLGLYVTPALLEEIGQEETLLLERLPSAFFHLKVSLSSFKVEEVFFSSPQVNDILEISRQEATQIALHQPNIWEEMIYPSDRSRVQKVQKQVLQEGAGSVIYRVQTFEDHIRWLKSEWQVIRQTEEGVELLATLKDFSEEQQRMIQTMLSIATHQAILHSQNAASLLTYLAKRWIDIPGIRFIWWGQKSEEEDDAIEVKYSVGEQPNLQLPVGFKYPFKDAQGRLAPVARAWLKGRSLVKDIERSRTIYQEAKKGLEAFGMASLYSFSIEVNGEPIALITLGADQPHYFTKPILRSLYRLEKVIETRLDEWALQSQIKEVTYYHPLTHLGNLNQLKEALKQPKESFSLVFIDLEDFGHINVVWGIAQGDQVLQQVATQLQDLLRPSEQLYHLEGDHFICYFEETDKMLIELRLKQCQESLKHAIKIGEEEIDIELRFGVVVYPFDYAKTEDIVELSMMAAHLSSSEFITFFSPSILTEIKQNYEIKQRLNEALEHDLFTFVYQPIVKLQSPKAVGAEVLIRLHDKQGKPISPERFISIAEQAGMIQQITRRVIQAAFLQVKGWLEEGVPIHKVAINLSAYDIADTSLFTWIETLWLKYHLSPHYFAFEITERVAIQQPEAVLTFIENINEVGSEVELDDFGVGHSSLAMLNELDVSVIKIDKRFVDRMLTDKKSETLIKLIIDTAHNIGSVTVAEGVETEAQFERLRALECDYIQGYYIAKPLPAEAFSEFAKQYAASQGLSLQKEEESKSGN